MKRTRLLSLLALLMTVATGAWAQDAKHSITATYGEQTRLLEQPLPYETTVGALYEAVTGEPFSVLLRNMTALEIPLSGITSNNTSVVIGDLNGVSTPVTVTADGKATVILHFGNFAQGIFVNVVPPLYVTMADGTKDAGNWTATVGTNTNAQALPVGELSKGNAVTLTYNGRLKVKNVTATTDAEPVKVPATVTTAPTGAAVVGVGQTMALVSGGVADGGTLMYQMTTTNTMPTSTVGFSADVPTAQTIKASGYVYVWYFVKADGTHTDSEIAATAIEVPVADIAWNGTNVRSLRVMGTFESYEREGVTLSANSEMNEAGWYGSANSERAGISFQANESGGYTFTAPNGKKFTKIVMTLTGSAGWDWTNLGDGWALNSDSFTNIATVTWTGSAAASTVDLLKDADNFSGEFVKYIAFYLSE